MRSRLILDGLGVITGIMASYSLLMASHPPTRASGNTH
jgi:hypothetical protein